RHYASERRALVRRHRTFVPFRRARRLDLIPLFRLRFLRVGDLGSTSPWRSIGRRFLFDQPLSRRVSGAACARRRHHSQPDTVGILSVDAGGAGASPGLPNAFFWGLGFLLWGGWGGGALEFV